MGKWAKKTFHPAPVISTPEASQPHCWLKTCRSWDMSQIEKQEADRWLFVIIL